MLVGAKFWLVAAKLRLLGGQFLLPIRKPGHKAGSKAIPFGLKAIAFGLLSNLAGSVPRRLCPSAPYKQEHFLDQRLIDLGH